MQNAKCPLNHPVQYIKTKRVEDWNCHVCYFSYFDDDVGHLYCS